MMNTPDDCNCHNMYFQAICDYVKQVQQARLNAGKAPRTFVSCETDTPRGEVLLIEYMFQVDVIQDNMTIKIDLIIDMTELKATLSCPAGYAHQVQDIENFHEVFMTIFKKIAPGILTGYDWSVYLHPHENIGLENLENLQTGSEVEFYFIRNEDIPVQYPGNLPEQRAKAFVTRVMNALLDLEPAYNTLLNALYDLNDPGDNMDN